MEEKKLLISQENIDFLDDFIEYTTRSIIEDDSCPVMVGKDGLYTKDLCDNLCQITNFLIRIITEKEGIYDDSEKSSIIWTVEIKMSKKSFIYDIDVSNLQKFDWVKQATKGRGYIEDSTDARRIFGKYLNYLIRQEKYKRKKEYEHAGWKKMDECSWRYVTHDGVIGRPLEQIYAKSSNQLELKIDAMGYAAFMEFWNIRMITQKHMCNGVFLQFYTLLSTMTTIFQEVGVPVNFLTAIIGKTNSLKTSTAKVFSNIFKGGERAEINFSSTKIAILEEIGKFSDALVLVDDITPKQDSFSAREQQEKLEFLIRSYGDRIPRKRSSYGVGEEKSIMPVSGCCLVTGEYLEGVKSSLSRIVKLEFYDTDVSTDILTKYQRNTWVVPTFIYDFISFLTDEMGRILPMMKENLNMYRSKIYPDELLPRHKDILSIMKEVIQLFYLYAIEKEFLDSSVAQKYAEEDFSLIYSIVVDNAKNVKEQTPAVTVIKSILWAIEEKRMKVYTDDAVSLADNNAQIILSDDTYWKILPEQVWKFAKNYCSEHGIFFPYTSSKAIAEILDIESFLYVSKESGKRRRTHKISSKYPYLKQRFLWIRKDKIAEVEKMIENV